MLSRLLLNGTVQVRDLSAENMKKHWKLEELDQIPM